MTIIKPKGTQDIMPDQIYKWRFLEGKFRVMADNYGFKEIRTPVFEYTELFSRGVGNTTDIVQKEMYTFEDNGGRSITLKPEGTASVARAFIEDKAYADVQPTKYCYTTACYRYEKPQKGRYKEFRQFGLEIFGTKSMLADAEVISFADSFFKDLGVNDLELRINSVGCSKCRDKYREALRDYFRPHYEELCETCKNRFEKNPMRIIDCKSPADKELAKDAPSILDYLCEECSQAFDDLKKNLDALEIDYLVDPTIVRGLDYYTKTAFEFVSSGIGAQGTVCGGGRYDHLIEEVGGPDVPGVGFGLGIERLLLLLEDNGIEIPEEAPMDCLVVVMGDRAKAYGQKLCRDLRKEGFKAELDLMERNMKGQFKYADRLGVKYALVIGDDELDKGVAQIRYMEESKQEEVKFEGIIDALRR